MYVSLCYTTLSCQVVLVQREGNSSTCILQGLLTTRMILNASYHFPLCSEEVHFNVPLPYSNNSQMKKRPTSAVGYKRPISQYARVAMAMGSHPRYRVRRWAGEGGGERASGEIRLEPRPPPPASSPLLLPLLTKCLKIESWGLCSSLA